MPKSPQSFGPERRIRKRPDFLRVQSTRKKFRSPHFIVAVADGRPGAQKEPQPRLGITVTTKVDKRAARRNRLKRRIRELFRRIPDMPKRSIDIVVIALEGAVTLDYDEVSAELLPCFARAGLVRRSRSEVK